MPIDFEGFFPPGDPNLDNETARRRFEQFLHNHNVDLLKLYKAKLREEKGRKRQSEAISLKEITEDIRVQRIVDLRKKHKDQKEQLIEQALNWRNQGYSIKSLSELTQIMYESDCLAVLLTHGHVNTYALSAAESALLKTGLSDIFDKACANVREYVRGVNPGSSRSIVGTAS